MNTANNHGSSDERQTDDALLFSDRKLDEEQDRPNDLESNPELGHREDESPDLIATNEPKTGSEQSAEEQIFPVDNLKNPDSTNPLVSTAVSSDQISDNVGRVVPTDPDYFEYNTLQIELARSVTRSILLQFLITLLIGLMMALAMVGIVLAVGNIISISISSFSGMFTELLKPILDYLGLADSGAFELSTLKNGYSALLDVYAQRGALALFYLRLAMAAPSLTIAFFSGLALFNINKAKMVMDNVGNAQMRSRYQTGQAVSFLNLLACAIASYLICFYWNFDLLLLTFNVAMLCSIYLLLLFPLSFLTFRKITHNRKIQPLSAEDIIFKILLALMLCGSGFMLAIIDLGWLIFS